MRWDPRDFGTNLTSISKVKKRYIRWYVANRIREVNDKMERIHTLKAQYAFKLLRICIFRSINFLQQVTPPHKLMDLWADFEAKKWAHTLRCLTLEERPPAPQGSVMRNELAKMRISLPITMGGAGHGDAVLTAPIAWVASVARCIHADPELEKERPGLRRMARHAHDRIMESIGETPLRPHPPLNPHRINGQGEEARKPEKASFAYPRNDQDALTEGTYYSDEFNLKPVLSLQKVLTEEANRHRDYHNRQRAFSWYQQEGDNLRAPTSVT
jgi:hypothetical protein